MEAHGGRILAESGGPGLGTRFILTIPAVDVAANSQATGPGPLSADSGWTARRRARVLAVDDEKRILGIIDPPVIFLSGDDGDQDVFWKFVHIPRDRRCI